MDPDIVTTVRLCFLGASFLVLFVYAVPPLRSRFLAYGARSSREDSGAVKEKEAAIRRQSDDLLARLLDATASLKVPHHWFTSFYLVSVLSSLFWAGQILSNGSLFQSVAENATLEPAPQMLISQIKLTWMMMLAQGCRRLYECLLFYKPSESRMWFGHWVLGVGFYLCMGIAVWVEGAERLSTHSFSIQDLAIEGPSLHSLVSIPLFFIASGIQHDSHAYLASIKPITKENADSPSDYQLPDHPVFHLVLTPHYFAECLIYLSITITAAPAGSLINKTLACALLFVIVNLGVTAEGTKLWYIGKFGEKSVEGRSRMIPYLY